MAESIAEVLEALYRALSSSDIGWFEERLATGPSIHITTTVERWISPGQFLDGLRRQFAEVALRWSTGEPLMDERGDMAWIADRPTIRFDDGSELAGYLTLVFVRENGTWKLAHSHLTTQ